jgi:hypothetical protein
LLLLEEVGGLVHQRQTIDHRGQARPGRQGHLPFSLLLLLLLPLLL